MNNISALALAAVLAAVAPFAAASGQDVSANTEVGADAGAGGEASAGMEAEGVADEGPSDEAVSDDTYTFADLQAAMESDFDIIAVNPETPIVVVPLSDLSVEGDVTHESLFGGESSPSSRIADLQAEIEGNVEIAEEIQSNGYEVANVVAIWAEGGEFVVVFVDDMAQE